MKPTEEQIREKLIDGWEIGFCSLDNAKSLSINTESLNADFYFGDLHEVNFKCYLGNEFVEVEYPDFLSGNYDLSSISQHYSPEEWQRIIDMCKDIVRLITGDYETGLDDKPEQVEQTLEEKVKALLPDCAELIDAGSDPIEIHCGEYHLKVSSELIWWREVHEHNKTHWTMCPLNKFRELIHKDLYDNLPAIAAEVKKHQPSKPTYEELEQRVAELEKQVDEEHNKAKDFHRESIVKSNRITELESQLQECISKTDHEAEVQKWRDAFDTVNENYRIQCDHAQFYMDSFHREYAKNAESGR